jgi:6-phosphofructokinase 2
MITDTKAYNSKPPHLERKSTVGAGDSLVAGMVLSLSKGLDMQQALHYAVASGTAATLNHGTELCNKQDTERVYNLICEEVNQMKF